MPAPRRVLLALGILTVLAIAPVAEGSIKIAGNASSASVSVNARGEATVTYVQQGRVRSAVVSSRGQVRYNRRAAGRDVSFPTSAVTLPMPIAIRQTRSGTFFALQAWRRLRGGPVELRFSRWRGAPTLLTLGTVCCRWRSEIVRGQATYHGRPIIGYRFSRAGVPLDEFGRNVYLDSLRGGRWERMMGIVARRPAGRFRLWIRPYWRGEAYRGRIIGPNWGHTLAPDAEASASSSL
jgi:hypothetical protein